MYEGKLSKIVPHGIFAMGSSAAYGGRGENWGANQAATQQLQLPHSASSLGAVPGTLLASPKPPYATGCRVARLLWLGCTYHSKGFWWDHSGTPYKSVPGMDVPFVPCQLGYCSELPCERCRCQGCLSGLKTLCFQANEEQAYQAAALCI